MDQKEELELQHNELLSYKNNLEELIDERTKELKIALERAEESDKLKREFLGNMKHEIRTPLNIIDTSAKLLSIKKNMEQHNKDKFYGMIHNSVTRLLRTNENIQHLSYLHTKPDIKTCNIKLSGIYRQIQDLSQKEHCSDKSITTNYNFDDGLSFFNIVSNSQYLVAAFICLLENSYKFTEFGEILISSKRIVDNIRFSFQDTGIGIAPEYHKEIFKPFYQVDSSITRPYEGNGVGLALIKAVVEQFGGNYGVESELGKGSTFWCEFEIVD